MTEDGTMPALRVDRSELDAWHAWSREFDRISGRERYRADEFVAWIERNLVGSEADAQRRSRRSSSRLPEIP